MKLFVIRHKTTQRLLSQSYAKGSTWWEPLTDKADPKELPRLFYSQKAAKSRIITWARGRAVKKVVGNVGFNPFSDDDDVDEWLEYEAVPGRNRNQLEVVPVYLQFGEPL